MTAHTGDVLKRFDPLVRDWFLDRFGTPTPPQALGWPAIADGEHTLIAAPTGSGKTLASFLVCIDQLVRAWRAGSLQSGVHVVYVSPLKALSNDIQRNLDGPLGELSDRAAAMGLGPLPIETGIRTGDTPNSRRQAMLRRPPHILVTTPESLYLLLTSEGGRKILRTTRSVIVDEIHALARDKRGSHLALTLERLEALTDSPPVRIGLSATQRPMEIVSDFLVGPNRRCRIVDEGHQRDLDLNVTVPASDLSAVCSNEQWSEVYKLLTEQILSHRSTLVFVNTRRMAERIAHRLREELGEDAVASHHGSLAKELRHDAEQRLKAGKLKAIVATASLEMGIDIGYIDLVVQIGSPRCIATLLQRIGRSGHSVGARPTGRLFPLSLDELLESLALVRAVRAGRLDTLEIPVAPLDILAQQIVAEVACGPRDEEELYHLFRQAGPYGELSRPDFDAMVELVSRGLTEASPRGAYLHRDRIHHRLRPRRGARLAAITSGGAIPENAEYRVVVEDDGTYVGSLDEDFAIESSAGDIFLLGNTSWQVARVRDGQVVVRDAKGAPPTVPFWFGEAPGRTIELSRELSDLRDSLQTRLADGFEAAKQWLALECEPPERALEQAVAYVAAQVRAIGLAPTADKIVFERFFDESGGMQLVIHAPLGARINRAWGLALRKRFCRSFDFELQAAATDNGIVLSLSPQHSLPLEQLFTMINTTNARHLLEQAALAAPMFQVRWRWNVTRALAVLRRQAGKKVPPHLQRFRSDDLLAAAFPETVGCLENHHGDVEIPSHPLVRQTMNDCLHEAMDLRRWLEVLEKIQQGAVELVPRDTREPSPFCQELLNANPYAFLDGAPLEERRTRAVAGRRGLEDVRDLASLDPEAILNVVAEAQPAVRDADELHDALMQMVAPAAENCAAWSPWFAELVAAGRAAEFEIPSLMQETHRRRWIAAERWPVVRSAYPDAVPTPAIRLPDELDGDVQRSDAWVELVRGHVEFSGPVSTGAVADALGLAVGPVHAAFEMLEGFGAVLRGQFVSEVQDEPGNSDDESSDLALERRRRAVQWCDRRLLARIHRRTLDGLRRQIEPAEPEDFVEFLVRHHRLHQPSWSTAAGVREAVAMLQGYEVPAGAWESSLLAPRCCEYEPEWLDQLFMSGELMWGRLRTSRANATGRPAAGGADNSARTGVERRAASRGNLNRNALLSVFFRVDLPWLLPMDRELDGEHHAYARAVAEALRRRGALFYQELQREAGLLPDHLDTGLRELSAAGVVTSDMFGAVRDLCSTRSHRRARSLSGPAGRWSLFANDPEPVEQARRLEAWCRLLLRRYGVLFADLLPREVAAPSWRMLAPTLRRMELRGEVRGGRFIRGVAGEQFALDDCVGKLREVRQQRESGELPPWVLVNACDPLNLTGVVNRETRVPSVANNLLALQGGRLIAARIRGQVEFFAEVEAETKMLVEHSLVQGRRLTPEDLAAMHDRWRPATTYRG
ncbi:MAG: DEAD/DEAH box helicase [Planctomycetales bacterium]|nr:DEAD/DEAH box helicase [Planctomycetales bacterium]